MHGVHKGEMQTACTLLDSLYLVVRLLAVHVRECGSHGHDMEVHIDWRGGVGLSICRAYTNVHGPMGKALLVAHTGQIFGGFVVVVVVAFVS